MLNRLNLDSLKEMDMSKVKTMGSKAMKQLKNLGATRMSVAGRSVSPLILGGAALALMGGAYLIMRNRKKMQLAGHTGMQGQVQPVK